MWFSKKKLKPGDWWVICDLSGFRVPASEARETWDGLLVDPRYWSPKHPQLAVRARREELAVPKPRPPKPPVFIDPAYGFGTLCFVSPSGATWVVYVTDDSALLVRPGLWGQPLEEFYLGSHILRVDDDGALKVSETSLPTLQSWKICSKAGKPFKMYVTTDGAVKLEAQ